MSLFRKRQNKLQMPCYPADRYEPVIRSSVCTGEKTACMRDRETGKLHEVMLIRDAEDLKLFSEHCGVEPDQIRTVY